MLDVCEHYNHSKAFEAFGFGAKIPPGWEVSHLFPLVCFHFLATIVNYIKGINKWIQDFVRRQPRVQGVQGVVDAYRTALSRVELSGPTNFEPCIHIFHQKCQKMPRDGSRYQVFCFLVYENIELFMCTFIKSIGIVLILELHSHEIWKLIQYSNWGIWNDYKKLSATKNKTN